MSLQLTTDVTHFYVPAQGLTDATSLTMSGADGRPLVVTPGYVWDQEPTTAVRRKPPVAAGPARRRASAGR